MSPDSENELYNTNTNLAERVLKKVIETRGKRSLSDLASKLAKTWELSEKSTIPFLKNLETGYKWAQVTLPSRKDKLYKGSSKTILEVYCERFNQYLIELDIKEDERKFCFEQLKELAKEIKYPSST